MTDATVNLKEVENFERLGGQWWEETGPFRPLHELNPTRVQYITEKIREHFYCRGSKSFEELSVLDVACGGGLLAEPLCRLGAQVTGIDTSASALQVARAHARLMGLSPLYRQDSLETLCQEPMRFHVVLALEILEHVPDPKLFVARLFHLVVPGGLLIVSTLNRTWKSYMMAILGAEYLLKWVPKGTHHWHQFLIPSEVGNFVSQAGGRVTDVTGMNFSPLERRWSLSQKTAVNYLMTATK